MIHKNINNLTSLWLTAAKPFHAFMEIKTFNRVAINFSDWPNRLWEEPQIVISDGAAIKEVLLNSATELLFSKWISLENDEHSLADKLGLTLKSTQIGMSLSLLEYTNNTQTSKLSFVKIVSVEHATLWENIFKQCFNYSIAHQLIMAIKDQVNFYLIADNQNTIGCVATFVKDNQIGIHSLGILNNYRKRGFAASIMHQILQEAQHSGLENVHLQSSRLGLNIYKTIGFKEIFKMCNYSA